jgi:hypothetical protein
VTEDVGGGVVVEAGGGDDAGDKAVGPITPRPRPRWFKNTAQLSATPGQEAFPE